MIERKHRYLFALYLLASLLIHLSVLLLFSIIQIPKKHAPVEKFRIVALVNFEENIVPHQEPQDRLKDKSIDKPTAEHKSTVEEPNLLEDVEVKDRTEHSNEVAEVEKAIISTPVPPEERIFYNFYSIDSPPEVLHLGLKRYPFQAKSQGFEGRVVLDVYLDKKGYVVRIEVVRRAGHGFDEAAIACAESMIWSPGVHQGKPVPVRVRLPMRFRLEG